MREYPKFRMNINGYIEVCKSKEDEETNTWWSYSSDPAACMILLQTLTIAGQTSIFATELNPPRETDEVKRLAGELLDRAFGYAVACNTESEIVISTALEAFTNAAKEYYRARIERLNEST